MLTALQLDGHDEAQHQEHQTNSEKGALAIDAEDDERNSNDQEGRKTIFHCGVLFRSG